MRKPPSRPLVPSSKSLLHRWAAPLALLAAAVVTKAPELRVVDLQPVGTNQSWQLRWNSTPGSDYQVQRAKDDQLVSVMSNFWQPLLSLRATSSVSTAIDPAGPAVQQRFYRVMQLTNGVNDTQPPFIVFSSAKIVADLSGEPALRLAYTATDNVAVASVTVREGGTSLGTAVLQSSNEWVFTTPTFLSLAQTRSFIATAADPAGNTNSTPSLGVRMADPDQFVALNAAGLVSEGQALLSTSSNEVSAFTFRPGGRDLIGYGQGLVFRFPNGARFVEQAGQTRIEFTDVTAQFGPLNILQFPAALVKSGGALKQLTVGPLDFAALADVFGVNPVDGIPVTLFGRFPLLWRGGVVEAGGIRDAQFSFERLGLPLPELSGGYSALRVEFTQSEGLRIPLQGEFTLPDARGNGPTLRAGAGHPLWLTLSPDGQISLVGRVEVIFPDGTRFISDVRLEDPNYELRIALPGLEFAGLDQLAGQLPSSPPACLPAQTNNAVLTSATDCLAAHARAYFHFNLAIAGAASGLASEEITRRLPPPSFSAERALIQAWGDFSLPPLLRPLSLDPVQSTVQQLGRSARSSRDLAGLLASRQALLRLKQAFAIGSLGGSTPALDALNEALTEVETAAAQLCGHTLETPAPLALSQLTELVAGSEPARVAASWPAGNFLTSALPDLVRRGLRNSAQGLGVVTGMFDAPTNPAINNLDARAAASQLQQIQSAQLNASMLGVSLAGIPVSEVLGQLSLRVFRAATNDLRTAELRGDYPAFLFALQPMIALVLAREQAGFPNAPALAPLPQRADLPALATRLDQMMQADLARAEGARALPNRGGEVELLLTFLRELPAGPTFSPAPFHRILQGTETGLAAALSGLSGNTSLASLLDLLRSGAAHAELARRFAFLPGSDWETNRLPQVINQLILVSQTSRGWPELNTAAEQLLGAANQMGRLNDQTRRRHYLIQAAAVIEAARTVSTQFWEGKQSLATGAAVLTLPGNLIVENASGAARFNREDGSFSGSFNGTLRLPDLNAVLTIEDASFDGSGAFEIAASGQFVLPPNDPVLTITIPSSRPIRIRSTPGDGVAFSGAANFQFSNGMFFNGDISLIDPVYSFSFTAGGLEFALASALAGQVPVFPGGTSFTATNLDLWNSYYENLSASLAPVTAAAGVLRGKAGGVGSLPPEPFASLEAFADWIELQVLLNGNPDPALSREALTDMLVKLAEQSFKQAAEQARLEDQEPPLQPLTDPAKAQPAKGGPPFVPRVLQIDFGPAGLTYAADGPGHAEGRVNPAHLTWNTVSADTSSGLLFANGSPVSGVTVDVGRRLTANGSLDMTFQPVAFSNPANGTLGMFDNALFRDGLTTFNLNNLQSAALAVRIGGLAPGHFLAYGMVLDTPLVLPTPDYDVSSGFIHAGQVRIGEPQPLFSPDVPVSGWSPGLNYAREEVELRESGDDLLFLSGALVGGGQIGKLQGLQLVETRPLITSYTLQPSSVDAGQPAELKWKTRFATKVSISGGIGDVTASGSRKLLAQRTARFTLTASNASGATVQSLTLVVDGPKRQTAALAEGLAKMAKGYRRISTHLDTVADRNLRGLDEYVDTARVQGELDKAKATYRELTSNPAALKDLKTFGNIVRAGFDLGATYQTTGFDDPVTSGEALSFFEKGKKEFERRFGGNAQTGEPEPAMVNARTADESLGIVVQLVNLGGLAAEVGSSNELNQALAQAHLQNARTKILATLEFNPDSQQVKLSPLAESDVAGTADQLLLIDNTSSSLNNPGSVPGAVYLQLGDRLQTLARETLDRLPPADWSKRFLSLQHLNHANDIRLHPGLPGVVAAFTAEIRSELLLEARQMSASAGVSARLAAPERTFLDFALGFLPDSELQTLFSSRLEQALAGIKTKIEEPWTPERLPEGVTLLGELLDLHQLLKTFQQKGGAHSISATLLAPAQIPAVQTQFTAAATAAADSEQTAKFTRALTAAEKVLGTGSGAVGNAKAGDPLVAILQQQAHAATRRHALILSNQVVLFQNGMSSFNPLDLGLPGSLRVTRVFGSILYNRETGFLQGGFGGRLEFPDVNAFFEVRNATVDNRGNFTIDAATATPLPLGGTRLEAEMIVAYTNNLLFVDGQGQLFVPTATATQVFSARITYDQPQNRLAFDTAAQNLNWIITEDFVLFEAGFGFDLSTASPNGSFRVSGSAGLFARAHPLPASITRSNFNLVVDGLTTVFSYSTNQFALSLSNGTIRLPEFFHAGLCQTNGGESATGPQIALVPGAPIAVSIQTFPSPVASFSGALDFRRIGFNVPGLTNLGVEVCSARLLFRSNALPCFTNLDATLSIPLPQQTAILDLTDVAWCVDGFPVQANIALRDPLTLLDVGGVEFAFQTNTTFGFVTSVNGGGQRHTAFNLVGGLRGAMDASLLFDPDTGGGFSFATSGSFNWDTDDTLPTFGLGAVTFAGHMKIGGASGFELLGVDVNGIPDTNAQSLASITLNGLTNLFQLAPNRPFEIVVNGALGSAEFVYFGLGDARFVFDGTPPEPQFNVASLGFREGNQLKLLGQELLPFRITAGSIAFLNPALPLNQLFDPANLRFTFSGVVDISLAPPDADNPNLPRLFGALDNVQVTLPGGFAAPPQFSVNTFVLALENLTIGDMAGLSGGLAVGNLNNPSELFFAGTAGGIYNGIGIKAIVATRLDGLIGLCLNVNAGPAGIPLDGGTLGGILLTGAEGGVSFLNQFADPCDFKSFLGLSSGGTPLANQAKNGTGPASLSPQRGEGLRVRGGNDQDAAVSKESALVGVTTPHPGPLPVEGRGGSALKVSQLDVLKWDDLHRLQKRHEQTKSLRQAGLAQALTPKSKPAVTSASQPKSGGADVPCPTGDCPPATLNLLCQRHPSVDESPSADNYQGAYSNRVIFKFSSLDKKAVDDLLAVANINLNGSASVVAGNFANAMTNLINGLIPRPPADLPAPQRQEINEFIDSSLGAMRGLVASASQAALEAAAGQGRTPLEALYEAAYGGVKCVDLTIQLKGTFSYAPVSVALNLQGGAVASTTGSAGVLGTVNLFGLPVGTGEFFYSLTDTNGNPNPSLCGNVRVALGPLEMGHMGLAIGCDECVTGTLLALAQFVTNLTGQVLTDASPIIYSFIESAASHRVNNIRSHPLTAFFGAPGPGVLLTQDEQVAVLTALLNLPQVSLFLQNNPGAVNEFGNAAVASLADATIQLILNIYNSTNPRLQFCGEVEPKIFGFSLTGGNTLVAARAFADKTNLRGDLSFSPSYVFGNLPFFLLSGGAISSVVPALDEATMGLSLGLPLVNETTLRLLTTNPVQFAETQVNHLLANATMTFGYELSPFGFKLADGEGRISLPTLDQHPDNPTRRAAQPNQYNGSGQYLPPSSPDRSAILKAALDSNVLAQATWAGKGGDLSLLFPAGSSNAQAVAGRELVRDYFPYGGFLGASKVQLPKPITDAPPLGDLAKLFAPPTNLIEQFTIAQNVFNNYVLGSREVGHLMLYVPFPRPPQSFWLAAQGPQALIDAIADTDVNSLLGSLNLYPAEQLFMEGGVNAQFLGLPIGEASLVADPAQGLFRIHAGTPAGSWMKSFFDAQMTFEIKRADYIAQAGPQSGPGTNTTVAPDTRLQAALDELLASSGGSDAQKQAAVNNAVLRITDTLPKMSLDVALNNFGIPPVLTNVLTASASARIVAYSPRFEPAFVGLGPVADARRNGGVAFQGQFNFANYVVIDNAELGVALRGTGLPALSGIFDVPMLGVPGLALHDAHFEFNSDPSVGNSYLAARGAVDPMSFINPLNGQPLLTIQNLSNAAARISAGFDLRRAAAGPPLPGFAISPSKIDMPMLGSSLSVRVHGASTNDPFTFSSTGAWTGKVSIVGALEVKDLFNNTVLSLGAAGTPFSATINGNGLSLGLLDIVLPTNITITAFPGTTNAQSFALTSGGVANRIMISGDGSFVLDGGIAGDLPLNGTGFGSISAGAAIHIDNNQLRVTITGNLTGGALSSLSGNASISSVSGQFIATRNGISLSGLATLSPMTFGVFRVSGATGGDITAVVTNFGFSIPTGARLRVQAPGYPTNDILTLKAFAVSGNGNFNIAAQNGDMNIPGYFLVTTGAFTFLRSNTIVSLDMFAPTLRLFPGKPYASTFVPPLQRVFVESTGRFYADTGNQQFSLPGAFVARGRLEFGYEPDFHQPGIGFPTNRLQFGTVTYGFTSNRVINVTNTGDAPLYVDIASSQPSVFSVTPSSLNLDADEVAAVSVRFTPPPVAGPTNGTLTFFHNAPGGFNSLSVTGSVRAAPILQLSSPAFDLGDTKVNQTITRGLRVDNLGLTNLLLTNQVLSGPFTVTPTNVTVPPKSNVVLQVTFTPTAISNFSGTLQIRNNDSGGTRNVPLAGSGSVMRWVDTRNGGDQFRSIATSGGSNALAAATNRVFYSDTRGHSWSQPESNSFPGLRAVAIGANSATGWLCGDGKLARKTTDGGRTWQSIPGLSGNEWRVVTDQGGISRAIFGGRDILSGKPAVAIDRPSGFDLRIVDTNALAFTLCGLAWVNVGSQGFILAQQVNSRILRSVDSGTNWTAITNFSQQSDGPSTIAMSSSGIAIAASYTRNVDNNFRSIVTSSLYRSANFGTTWTRVLHMTNVVFASLAVDTNVCYAVGRTMTAPGIPVRGMVFRSGDGGLNWTEEDVEVPPVNAVAARLGETLTAGDGGDIHRRPLNPPTRGVIEFDPGAVNFGFVPFGDSSPRAITFYNAGISNITITNVTLLGTHASQFAVGGGGFPKTIPPGGSDSINIFCNPTNAGNLTASLRINANDPEGFFSASLTARSSSSGWVLKAPLTNSAGFTVVDIQMFSATTGYALNARNLYKTTNGGLSWQVISTPAVSGFTSMDWLDESQGFLAGGSLATPLVSAGNSFIYRTANGGGSWILEYSNTDRPVNNIQVRSDGIGYAVTFENFRVFNDSGQVLKTVNGGLSWFAVTTPVSGFSGRAMVVNGATEVFASSGAVLFRSIDGGTNWTRLATNGSSVIRSLDFATASTFGLAVGDDGVYRRTTSGGDEPGAWVAGAAFTTNDLNWVQMLGVTVTWAVPTATAPGAQIWRSDDLGSTWREELAESPYAGPTNLLPTVLSGRTTFTNSLALGTDGSVRRFEVFANELEGVAVSQPRLDFGQSVEGAPKFASFVLRNSGDRVLNVSNLFVNGLPGFNDDFRPTNAVPFSIPISGAVNIGIMASNLVVGTNLASLGIISDGALQSLKVELRSVVTPQPVVISFATDPPGLPLSIDGTNVIAPASYNVRLEPGGTGDWDMGSLHVIRAPETQLVNGVTFTFAGWLPFEEGTFTHMATNTSVQYVASYIATGEQAPPAAGFAFLGKSAMSGPPAGLPTGPYLRLTQASISNSLLGNFAVSGSVLLSAELIEATLDSEAFRLPAAPSLPALIQVSAGAWRFSLSNEVVRLKAQSPAVTILSNVVNPPSVFTLGLNLSNANFAVAFSLPQGVKIAPGLLEVGPGSATLTHTTFFSLNVTGEVRALRKPESNNDWAFKQNLNLTLRDGPFTNSITLPSSVVRLTVPGAGTEFFEIRGGPAAKLEVRRNSSGVFFASMQNIGVDVLNQSVGTYSASISSAGMLSLSVTQASPFVLGPFVWEASGGNALDWNIKNGSFSIALASGSLKSNGGTVPGWPGGGVNFPGFTFDSNGDFDRTITMPTSFNFFGINLGQANDSDNRYIRLKRVNGVLSAKLRDRVEFFDSNVKVGFDIGNNGNASGFFDGSFGVDFGIPIGYVHFGDVEASFDSSEPSYQFKEKVRVSGNDFRVKFGSGGARICHLYCDDGCSETLCLDF